MSLFTGSNTGYITVTDVSNYLNANISGSNPPNRTFWFWRFDMNEQTIQWHINYGEFYLRYLLGEEIWNTTDPNKLNMVITLDLEYVVFRLLVVIAGGLITRGFDYRIGDFDLKRMMAIVPTFKMMLDGLKYNLELKLKAIHPMSLTSETSQPEIGQTAPPTF